MFLPLPILDDRRWPDLVQEAQALVPLYGPDWTDHNVSDPGITFAELFAWLAEMDLFQLDQVPARHRRKFLALLGIAPEPPEPARTVLRFEVAPGTAPVLVPATAECTGPDPYGTLVLVRTCRPVYVIDTTLAGIDAVDGAAGSGITPLTGRWRRGEPFAALGPDPRPGSALRLTLSDPPPPDVPLSIAVTVDDPPPALDRPHHSARTVWEAQLGTGSWRRLPAADTTRALTQSGQVELTVPDGTGLGRPAYLRCRLAAGAYDAAPVLRDLAVNGVPAEQAVPAGELAWTITETAVITGTPAPGAFARIGIRLDAQHRITALDTGDPDAPELLVLRYRAPAPGAPGSPGSPGSLAVEASRLGAGTGAPSQAVTCQPAPVQPSSLRLYTLGRDSCWQEWAVVADFDASGPADRHAVLDATTGALTFGDGRHGLAVPEGAAVVAAYRSTAAQAGGLAAGGVGALADSAHNAALFAAAGAAPAVTVTNPVPLAGGAAAQTLEDAEARAAELPGQPTRAVTAADYQALAMQTPGTRLARAAVLPDTHPGLPCVTAVGVITVVIVPYLPLGRPAPSPGLRHAVAAYLGRRRMLGTRVEVTGPAYTEVSVSAQVLAARSADATDLAGRLRGALDGFFDPLAGGPDGAGWPLGRDVYRLEVMRVLDEVPGVEHVLALELLTADGAQCGNVCIGPIGLVAAGTQQIEVVPS
jgi:predicted phage baseplate assembly protein